MNTILEVSQVAKRYKKQTVLKDINFKVYPGEVIALLGENGAGKSTLINCINHLITTTSGKIDLFDGETSSKKIKEKVGIMLQNNIVIPKLTVKEVLELSRSYYNSPVSLEELVEMGQLEPLLSSEMTKLSGGQQRRVSFVLSLVGNPDLIFLDEPTASMDAKSRNTLWQKVSQLRDAGKTIIVTSHYLEELEKIASRILILQEGMITFDGTMKELREIQGEGVISFDTDISQAIFEEFTGIIRITRQARHFQIISQDTIAIVKQLVNYLDQIENLTIQQTSLETLFTDFDKGVTK